VGENVTSALPKVIAAIEASRKAAQADLSAATAKLASYDFRRNNSYETYTRQFQEVTVRRAPSPVRFFGRSHRVARGRRSTWC
jgi:hypothetical protein